MYVCVLGSHLLFFSLSSLLRFRFRFLNPKDDDDEKEIISIVSIIWKILLYSLYLNQTLFSLKHIKSNYSLDSTRFICFLSDTNILYGDIWTTIRWVYSNWSWTWLTLTNLLSFVRIGRKKLKFKIQHILRRIWKSKQNIH